MLAITSGFLFIARRFMVSVLALNEEEENKYKQHKATKILKKLSKAHRKEYEFHEKQTTKHNQCLLFSEDNQRMKNGGLKN